MEEKDSGIRIAGVTSENWREIFSLEVYEEQKEFVAEPGYYLCLCAYGGLWNPLAIYFEDLVIGFLMWAVDPEDGSCWLGGIFIDKSYQGRGLGRKAIGAAVAKLSGEEGVKHFALSYLPNNPKIGLYKSLGFEETGEMEDDEIVARLRLP